MIPVGTRDVTNNCEPKQKAVDAEWEKWWLISTPQEGKAWTASGWQKAKGWF